MKEIKQPKTFKKVSVVPSAVKFLSTDAVDKISVYFNESRCVNIYLAIKAN
jgi:hypothetical protein